MSAVIEKSKKMMTGQIRHRHPTVHPLSLLTSQSHGQACESLTKCGEILVYSGWTIGLTTLEHISGILKRLIWTTKLATRSKSPMRRPLGNYTADRYEGDSTYVVDVSEHFLYQGELTYVPRLLAFDKKG